MLDFLDEEIKKLKMTFDQLDEDGGGSISMDELEMPLIGLGLADTREEIQQMIDEVDEDGSGQIEFDEFLLILKNTISDPKTAKINQFFKDMSSGELNAQDLSFNQVVAEVRRRFMMDSILATNPQRQAQGEKILRNVRDNLIWKRNNTLSET